MSDNDTRLSTLTSVLRRGRHCTPDVRRPQTVHHGTAISRNAVLALGNTMGKLATLLGYYAIHRVNPRKWNTPQSGTFKVCSASAEKLTLPDCNCWLYLEVTSMCKNRRIEA